MIIGAMKCGTSSLYSYLSDHREICPASTKEPEFFSENQAHKIEIANYNDLWSFDDSVHKYVLEASTGYTKYPLEPNVPKNIFNYGIRPKFIYIIRNPFDRISSHFNFMHNKRSWHLSINDEHLISTSNYFLQLEQFRKYFLLKDILVLDFDELRDSPTLLLQKVYKFLGISQDYFPGEYKVKNRTRIDSKFENHLRKLNFVDLFRHMPKPMRRVGKALLQRLSIPKRRVLTDIEKEIVHDALRESMANLYQTYGIDVSKWGFKTY